MALIFNYKGIKFDFKKPVEPTIDNNIDWSRTGDQDASPLHSISSYLAMFAPAVPKYFIEKLTKENDLIYDPFSGRGTTALKSRELDRRFVGSDLNPYALVLSRAKIATCSKTEALKFVENLETKFEDWNQINENRNKIRKACFKELKIFYSNSVLKQLIFLREYASDWRNFNDIENFVFGITLGLMHGQMRKDGTTMYFSLDMPNTISMAPNYVKKFAEEKGLKKPTVNVFLQIKNRINKKYDKSILEKTIYSRLYEKNALETNHEIFDESVDLLITSPPYLSVVDYTNSNWLKLWLLGYERKELRKEIKLSDRLKFNEYIDFITTFLNSVHCKIKPGGHIALIVGDVHEKRLIEEVWSIIQDQVKFKLIRIYWDNKYLQEKKITNMLNKKKGKVNYSTKIGHKMFERKWGSFSYVKTFRQEYKVSLCYEISKRREPIKARKRIIPLFQAPRKQHFQVIKRV